MEGTYQIVQAGKLQVGDCFMLIHDFNQVRHYVVQTRYYDQHTFTWDIQALKDSGRTQIFRWDDLVLVKVG